MAARKSRRMSLITPYKRSWWTASLSYDRFRVLARALWQSTFHHIRTQYIWCVCAVHDKALQKTIACSSENYPCGYRSADPSTEGALLALQRVVSVLQRVQASFYAAQLRFDGACWFDLTHVKVAQPCACAKQLCSHGRTHLLTRTTGAMVVFSAKLYRHNVKNAAQLKAIQPSPALVSARMLV